MHVPCLNYATTSPSLALCSSTAEDVTDEYARAHYYVFRK